jgi:hypothetical protein
MLGPFHAVCRDPREVERPIEPGYEHEVHRARLANGVAQLLHPGHREAIATWATV